MRFTVVLVCFAYLGWSCAFEDGRQRSNRAGDTVFRHTRAIAASWVEHMGAVLMKMAGGTAKKLTREQLLVEFDEETAMLEKIKRKPKMIVFDLNHTLWPFTIDSDTLPPYTRTSETEVQDLRGQILNTFPETKRVFSFLRLHDDKFSLAVASRTTLVEDAEDLLNYFGLKERFRNIQIYPGRKEKHLNTIKNETGVGLDEMLFFDDRSENVNDAMLIGVTALKLKHGISMDDLFNGFQMYHTASSNGTEMRDFSVPDSPDVDNFID